MLSGIGVRLTWRGSEGRTRSGKEQESVPSGEGRADNDEVTGMIGYCRA